jgi:hypothetical protein
LRFVKRELKGKRQCGLLGALKALNYHPDKEFHRDKLPPNIIFREGDSRFSKTVHNKRLICLLGAPIGQKVACGGGSEEQVALVELYWSQSAKATNYDECRQAVEVLSGIPYTKGYTRLEMTNENDWKPLKHGFKIVPISLNIDVDLRLSQLVALETFLIHFWPKLRYFVWPCLLKE